MTDTKRKNQVMRGHQLLTAELRQRLPAYRATEAERDPVAYVKFFTPDSSWYWYVTEFDGHDTFFGLVFGSYVEIGSFSLSELEELRGPLGLPVERDRFYEPKRLAEIKREHREREGEIRHY